MDMADGESTTAITGDVRRVRRARRRFLRQLAHVARKLDLEDLREARDYARWLLTLEFPSESGARRD